MNALSKHLKLEDGDSSYWKNPDPDATSCASVANKTDYCPHYEYEIEWVNTDGGKVMKTSGHHFPDELEHHK